jgi:KUP system potassium uptake protein
MAITTILSALVFHKLWGWSWARTLALTTVFLIVDLAFFSANLLKIFDGGWAPILIVIITFTLMTTWKRGRSLLYKRLESEAMALDTFVEAIGAHPPTRVQGSAVFMTPNPKGVPHALLHNLKHNKVLHAQVVITTVKVHEVPIVPQKERLQVEDLDHGFYRVTVNYGFKDEPDLPRDLEACAAKRLKMDMMDTSFFIGKETLILNLTCEMAVWREKLFITMFRNADTVSNYFKLPPNRVVELGTQVSI